MPVSTGNYMFMIRPKECLWSGNWQITRYSLPGWPDDIINKQFDDRTISMHTRNPTKRRYARMHTNAQWDTCTFTRKHAHMHCMMHICTDAHKHPHALTDEHMHARCINVHTYTLCVKKDEKSVHFTMLFTFFNTIHLFLPLPPLPPSLLPFFPSSFPHPPSPLPPSRLHLTYSRPTYCNSGRRSFAYAKTCALFETLAMNSLRWYVLLLHSHETNPLAKHRRGAARPIWSFTICSCIYSCTYKLILQRYNFF